MDLSTKYMGLSLRTPLVAGASPLSKDLSGVEALAEAGASAVVLHSIFQEQLVHEAAALDYYTQKSSGIFFASGSYFAAPLEELKLGPEQYLDKIAAARKAVDIPIITSINAFSVTGWGDYARSVEQAGASALELNLYIVPADPAFTGQQVEQTYFEALESVKRVVKIPVAMKLSPFFSSMSNMAVRLAQAGADALVLFNRFYQPDLDVETLDVVPHLVLSTSAELRLPLRWIAILNGRVNCSLAGSTGVHTGLDAAKMILAGADVVMLVSSLLRNGLGHIGAIERGLAEILEAREYSSVAEARGVLSQRHCPDPSAFERANYMKLLQIELPGSVGATNPGPPMPS